MLAAWLDLVAQTARSNFALAVQVARLRSLVKGYGDTLGERGDSVALLKSLIKAALADEQGEALDEAVANLMLLPDLVTRAAATPAACNHP